ncbi:MAG TPA: hypothetical protein O0X50_04390 [Methanocorpusculum sp.]|nr:hypothetical protein [Methanocorpusculum sp.]
MEDVGLFVLFLVICIVVVAGTTIIQYRMRMKRGDLKQVSEKKQEFVVGRIYQMKDGSLAKYVGDNKFLKVKMK